MKFQDWLQKGRYYTISGKQLFVIDEGNLSETLLILHGYPSSSFDYWKVLPTLSKKYRVIIHDQIGFGLSDKPNEYSYSLVDQADIALQLWERLGIKEAYLLAHDYGTSVTTELIHRFNLGWLPIKLKSVLLCNGSMRIEMAKLRLIQKLLLNQTLGPWIAKFSSKRIFIRNMRNIWGDPKKADLEELSIMWEMLLYKEGRRALPWVSQYLKDRYKFWHRWIGALRETKLPITYLWATLDPVAVIEMAKTLHQETPNSQLVELENLGHYPMLEDPEKWGKAVLKILT